jgi:hypothetical protein
LYWAGSAGIGRVSKLAGCSQNSAMTFPKAHAHFVIMLTLPGFENLEGFVLLHMLLNGLIQI